MRDYWVPRTRRELIRELRMVWPRGSFSRMRKGQLYAIFFRMREGAERR